VKATVRRQAEPLARHLDNRCTLLEAVDGRPRPRAAHCARQATAAEPRQQHLVRLRVQQAGEHHRLRVHVHQLLRVAQVETALLDLVTERQVAEACILVDVDLAFGVLRAMNQVAEFGHGA